MKRVACVTLSLTRFAEKAARTEVIVRDTIAGQTSTAYAGACLAPSRPESFRYYIAKICARHCSAISFVTRHRHIVAHVASKQSNRSSRFVNRSSRSTKAGGVSNLKYVSGSAVSIYVLVPTFASASSVVP